MKLGYWNGGSSQSATATLIKRVKFQLSADKKIKNK